MNDDEIKMFWKKMYLLYGTEYNYYGTISDEWGKDDYFDMEEYSFNKGYIKVYSSNQMTRNDENGFETYSDIKNIINYLRINVEMLYED